MDITRIDQQAERLRRARMARGCKTAKEAAQRFGFNYNTYSQHERGQSAITRAAKDYARAYKVSEAWLLTGEGAGLDDASRRDVYREIDEIALDAPDIAEMLESSIGRQLDAAKELARAREPSGRKKQ